MTNGQQPNARGAANNAKDAVSDAASQVAEKAQQYGNRASQAASDAYDTVKEGVHDARRKAEEWGRDAYHAASENLGNFGDEATRLVRNHPIPALLVGFGIGFLIGRAAKCNLHDPPLTPSVPNTGCSTLRTRIV